MTLDQLIKQFKRNLLNAIKTIVPSNNPTDNEVSDKVKKVIPYLIFDKYKKERITDLYKQCGLSFNEKDSNPYTNTYTINREMDKLLKTESLKDEEKKELLFLMHIVRGSGEKSIQNYQTNPIIKRDFDLNGKDTMDVNERTRYRIFAIAFLLGLNSEQTSDLLSLLHVNGKIHYRSYDEVIFAAFLDNPGICPCSDPTDLNEVYKRFQEALWLTYELEPEQVKRMKRDDIEQPDDSTILRKRNNIHDNLTVRPLIEKGFPTLQIRNAYMEARINGSIKELDSFKRFYKRFEHTYGMYNETLRVTCTDLLIDIIDNYDTTLLPNCCIDQLYGKVIKEIQKNYNETEENDNIKDKDKAANDNYSIRPSKKDIDKVFTRFDLIYLLLLDHEMEKRSDGQSYITFGDLTSDDFPSFGDRNVPQGVKKAGSDFITQLNRVMTLRKELQTRRTKVRNAQTAIKNFKIKIAEEKNKANPSEENIKKYQNKINQKIQKIDLLNQEIPEIKHQAVKGFPLLLNYLNEADEGCNNLLFKDEKLFYQALFKVYRAEIYLASVDCENRLNNAFECFCQAINMLSCISQEDIFYALKSVMYRLMDLRNERTYGSGQVFDQYSTMYTSALYAGYSWIIKNHPYYRTHLFNCICAELGNSFDQNSDEYKKMKIIEEKLRQEYLPELIEEINDNLQSSGFSEINIDKPKGLFDIPFAYLVNQELPWTENIAECFINIVNDIRVMLPNAQGTYK